VQIEQVDELPPDPRRHDRFRADPLSGLACRRRPGGSWIGRQRSVGVALSGARATSVGVGYLIGRSR
jgi:hypothetical protein